MVMNMKENGKQYYIQKYRDIQTNTRHGRGVCWRRKEDIVEGFWNQGIYNGKVRCLFEGGDIFEGMTKNGKANGFGKKSYLCGDYYEGYFTDDK